MASTKYYLLFIIPQPSIEQTMPDPGREAVGCNANPLGGYQCDHASNNKIYGSISYGNSLFMIRQI
jgi:hypothetical protein